LWRRELVGYPTGGYRIFLLAIVVLPNIVFTWTVAAGTAATPVMFVHFGMTLNYYATCSWWPGPSGWKTWFYICIGCVVVFVPFIFTMHGPWRPATARAEYQAHQARVAEELRRLKTGERALGS
jgi:hypothetical protein